MRTSVLALAACLAAAPTLAAPQGSDEGPYEPKPVKGDPHICTVEYTPNRVLVIHETVGDSVTLQMADGETMGGAMFSDSANLKAVDIANFVSLKAIKKMEPRPNTIRMVRADGTARPYVFQWETGDRGCYLIRFTYSADALAAKRAAWARAAAARRAQAAEAALATPQPSSPPNTSYSLRGDSTLLQQVRKAP